MKITSIFVMSFWIASVYGMKPIEPFLPYDIIEDIVCLSYVEPVVRACRTIIDTPYKEENSVLCDKLIQKYKKIGPLKQVCKRAEEWFDRKWYDASCGKRQHVLRLTQGDCDGLLQKSVLYQHRCCFYFSILVGADVNATVASDDRNGLFLQGLAPLFFAIYNGDFGMFSLLLQYGANVDIRTLGNLTPARVAHAIMDTCTSVHERLPYRRILAALRYEKKKRERLRKEAICNLDESF